MYRSFKNYLAAGFGAAGVVILPITRSMLSPSHTVGSSLSEEQYLRYAGHRKWADIARWVFFVIFYALCANIPFWAASRWLGIRPIGLVCTEYALMGVLALFMPRTVPAALLLLVIAADLTCAVSKTYYLTPADCLANLNFIQELPGSRLLYLFAVAAFTLIVIAVAIYFPVAKMRRSHRLRAAACLIAFILMAEFADYLEVVRETGHILTPFQLARPGNKIILSDFENFWIARNPTIRLMKEEKVTGIKRNAMSASQGDHSPVESAAAMAIRSAGIVDGKEAQAIPNVVLVLVESWGLDTDSAVRDSFASPYSQPDLLARYKVLQGTVPFYGSTVPGEARELCGNKIGFQIMNISKQESQSCLPARLDSLGYHSIALHGLVGDMFSRSTWYDIIGFHEQWFRDRFRQQGLPDCPGPFVGTCDANIAEWIGRFLEKRTANPNFVYWVTLNSHLPVPVPSALPASAPCSLTPLLSNEPVLCSWYQLVYNVHSSLSKIAMADLGRPTVFVIVGDHAPPWANPNLLSQFSSTEVPYVILLPRQEHQYGKS